MLKANNNLTTKFLCHFLLAFLLSILCNTNNVVNAYYYDTIAFTPGANHRSNFCDRHLQTETGELSVKDALRGQNISVGLFRYQLKEQLDAQGNFTGTYLPREDDAAVQFLDAMAERSGFTWRNTFGILNSPKKELNQTWTELLHWTIDTYDLMGDWYLRTMERLGVGIVFPEGWYDGSLIMVRRKPDTTEFQYNFWALTLPFTNEVWWTFLGTIILCGLLLYFLGYLDTISENKEETKLNPLENQYVSLIAFTGHLLVIPKAAGRQILIFSMCFLFTLILAAYTANLASVLVSRSTKQQKIIMITDISDAIKEGMSFCVLQSSTSQNVLEKEYNVETIIEKDSIGDTYLAVLDGECDIVLTTVGTWNQNQRSDTYNRNCELEWVGRVVKHVTAGFSLRDSQQYCSSLFRDVLSYHMVDMKLENEYDTIWNNLIDQDATIDCHATAAAAEDDEETTTTTTTTASDNRLSIQNLGGIFLLQLFCTIVALASSFYHYFKVSKPKLKELRAKRSSQESSSSQGQQSIQEENEASSSLPQPFNHDENNNSNAHNNVGQEILRKSLEKRQKTKQDHDVRDAIVDDSNSIVLSELDCRASVVSNSYEQQQELEELEKKRQKENLVVVAIMVSAVLVLWIAFFILFYL